MVKNKKQKIQKITHWQSMLVLSFGFLVFLPGVEVALHAGNNLIQFIAGGGSATLGTLIIMLVGKYYDWMGN